MRYTFYGVRGSYPTPDKNMIEYGGKTSCVVFSKKNGEGKIVPLIIDAGLGIIDAGKAMIPMILNGEMVSQFPILFTHLHPDHTEGFTFFGPNFLPQVKIDLMGPSALKKNVGMVLRDKMAPPTYPIEYKDLKSTRTHGIINDGDEWWVLSDGKIVPENKSLVEHHNSLNGTQKPYWKWRPDSNNNIVFVVKAMQSFAPSHPQQGCIYYRVYDAETTKSVACIWDIESRYGGDQRVIAFAKDADVMIHDTQYTTEEYNSSKMIVQGFGHSTYEMAVENAIAANIKTLHPFHYNPNHTDAKLDEIIRNVGVTAGFSIVPAKEGRTHILGE